MKAIAIAITLAALVALSPRAEARGCRETSYVVGFQKCSWFGTWSRDADIARIWWDLGYFHREYTSQPFSLGTAALATHDSNDLATTSSGLLVRILGGIGGFFYTGLELEPGWIDKVPIVPGPTPNDNSFFAMHWIAGVHASLFRFAVSTELAGGFRVEDWDSCSDKACTADSLQTRRELDARIRIDAFFVPRVSVGLMFGRSLIDADDHSVMIYLAGHIRAMDGMH